MSNETLVMTLLEEGNPATEVGEDAATRINAAAYLATLRDRSSAMDTKQLETSATTEKKGRRGWLVAAVALVAVLIIGVGAVMATSSDDGIDPAVAETPQSLAGHSWTVVGGTAGSRPDSLEFDEGGAFRVIQRGNTIDSGSYTVEADTISFVSVARDRIPGRLPGVVWFDEACHGPRGDGGIPQCTRPEVRCEGVTGDYVVVFEGPSAYTLDVTWDECTPRVTVANGLKLELASG